MTDSELVVVRRFPSRIEGELAQTALEAAEIGSMLRVDDCGGLRPAMSFGLGVDLMVRAADAERAAEVLGPD